MTTKKKRVPDVKPFGFSVIDDKNVVVSTGYPSRGSAVHDARFLLGPRLGRIPRGWRILNAKNAAKLQPKVGRGAVRAQGL